MHATVDGHQSGQALAEALIVLIVLGSLWVGIAWLGRLQDVSLQLAHASRYAAFAEAHQGRDDTAMHTVIAPYVDAPGHRWQTRQGLDFLAQDLALAWQPVGEPQGPQPGDPMAAAADLRRELQLGDPVVWRVAARVRTAGHDTTAGLLADFDHLGLSLNRQTAILRGDGAAQGDAQVQAILAGSARAWGDAAAQSRHAGETIFRHAGGVDVAWGRAVPAWNWIDAWTGSVPRPHLQPWRQP